MKPLSNIIKESAIEDAQARQKAEQYYQKLKAWLNTFKSWDELLGSVGDFESTRITSRARATIISSKEFINGYDDLSFGFTNKNGNIYALTQMNAGMAGEQLRLGHYVMVISMMVDDPHDDATYNLRASKIELQKAYNKGVITHEFMHYLDQKRSKMSDMDKARQSRMPGDPAYYNDPHEWNAYFQEAIYMFNANPKITKKRILNTFESFKRWMYSPTGIALFPRFVEHLTAKNKQKLDKRLYTTYMELRSEIT